jgi:hypothetical protein
VLLGEMVVLRLQNSNELFENDLLTNLAEIYFQKVYLHFEGVKRHFDPVIPSIF